MHLQLKIVNFTRTAVNAREYHNFEMKNSVVESQMPF